MASENHLASSCLNLSYVPCLLSPDHMRLALTSAEEAAEYFPLETEKSHGRLQTEQQQPTRKTTIINPPWSLEAELVSGQRTEVLFYFFDVHQEILKCSLY